MARVARFHTSECTSDLGAKGTYICGTFLISKLGFKRMSSYV